MTIPFDTGLLRSQREVVQDKIIELLEPFRVGAPGGGGFLEAIEPISFRVTDDDYEIDMLDDAVGKRSPAIAIAALDLASHRAGGPGNGLDSLEIQIYVISRHRRGRTDGRARLDPIALTNAGADPGVFAILELVWSRLYDVDLKIPTLHELTRVKEQPLHTAEEQSIWSQEWSLTLTSDADLQRGITQKFTNAATKLKLPEDPGGRINANTTVG